MLTKASPQHSFIDSAFRHLKKYWTGETDEPHLRAAAWNILWALQQETTHPELIDLPGREKPTHLEELRAKMREAIEKTFPPDQRARKCVYPVTYLAYIHDKGDHFVGITHAGDEVILPKQTDEGGA